MGDTLPECVCVCVCVYRYGKAEGCTDFLFCHTVLYTVYIYYNARDRKITMRRRSHNTSSLMSAHCKKSLSLSLFLSASHCFYSPNLSLTRGTVCIYMCVYDNLLSWCGQVYRAASATTKH